MHAAHMQRQRRQRALHSAHSHTRRPHGAPNATRKDGIHSSAHWVYNKNEIYRLFHSLAASSSTLVACGVPYLLYRFSPSPSPLGFLLRSTATSPSVPLARRPGGGAALRAADECAPSAPLCACERRSRLSLASFLFFVCFCFARRFSSSDSFSGFQYGSVATSSSR